MKDSIFKKLKHCYQDYEMYSNGGESEKGSGYRPDYVLKKRDNYIVLECENSSSRKTFVGGMLKAAFFLTGKRKGILIFAIVPKKNTKVLSIAEHLKKYLLFIQGYTNLKAVYVIEAEKYSDGLVCVQLDGDEFKCHAIKV